MQRNAIPAPAHWAIEGARIRYANASLPAPSQIRVRSAAVGWDEAKRNPSKTNWKGRFYPSRIGADAMLAAEANASNDASHLREHIDRGCAAPP
jgi:hypothetical protein